MATSPFYAELFEALLQKDALSKQELAAYNVHMQQALHAGTSVSDALETYQHIFLQKTSTHLEKQLLEKLPLKILRGLPRLYNKDNPSQNHIKSHFANLPSLIKLSVEKWILPIYTNYRIPKGTKITLFTWMIPDGFGDWITHKEIKAILQEQFPEVLIQSIALVSQKFAPLQGIDLVMYYEKECPHLSLEILQELRSSDLILSIPTFYPHTDMPRCTNIGQYGFVESSWFHPQSGNRSMGLHFLEQGILIRNQSSKRNLFEDKDLENLTDTFYFAYLVSPIGGAIYLHALLQSLSDTQEPIHICTPNIDWLIQYIEIRNQEKKPFLEQSFGVSEIEIYFDGHRQKTKIANTGKTVHIFCPKNLSDSDFRLLVSLAQEFVAVRGDQSFSEVVSAGKLFFYDGAPHARYFVKDLVALAENRLRAHKGALLLFRSIGRAYLHNLPKEEKQWVDETFFQEKEPWQKIASDIAIAIQNPDTLTGYKKFSQIVKEEYSFNKTLCQVVQKELAHHFSKNLANFEKQQITHFLESRCTLSQLLQTIETALFS